MRLISEKEGWKRSQENRFIEAINKSALVSITDVKGIITFANTKFCKISGYKEEELIGQSHNILKSGKQSNQLFKELWKTISKGVIWRGEICNRAKDGDYYWVDASIIPFKGDDGKIEKFVAVRYDITESKLSQEALSLSEAKLKSFEEHSPNLVLTINKEGEVLYNRQIRGTSIKKEFRTAIYNFIDPEFHKFVENQLNILFNDLRSSQFEIKGLNEYGEKADFLVNIGPVFSSNGKVVSAIFFAQDITESKQSEKSLIGSEAKFHSIFQSVTGSMIIVANERGIITEWNIGAEKSFGYKVKEVIGQPMTVLFPKRYKRIVLKGFEKAQSASYSEEARGVYGVRKNGEEFPLEMTLGSWKNNEDSFFTAIMRDISKRKIIEKKLKAKTKELKMFFSRSAHDLSAPFASAEGLINLIKTYEMNEDMGTLVNMLDTVVKRGKFQVDNLTLASVKSVKLNENEVIDFSKIVAGNLETLSGTDKFEAVDFKVEIKVMEEFYSSHNLINSIFQNLLHNVVKYQKSTLERENPNALIQVSSFEEGIKIKVKDNGQGIHRDRLDKVFDLCYRANYGDEPGTGLGLYIVKNIVKDLGGKISVESELNEGTCFEIVLPKN